MGHILVVDDEKSIRNTLSRFLGNDGHEVKVAGDAEEAIKLFHSFDFDAVITDIVMPKHTGMDLLKLFKAADPDVPVVMMTGEPTVETAAGSVRAGAFDYLTKPIVKETVLETIKKTIIEKKEKVKLKNHIFHSQKMETIGLLTGGIVHDFNNILFPIIGYTQLAAGDAEPGSKLHSYLTEVLVGTKRAGDLVRRILSLTRKTEKEVRPVRVKLVLAEVLKLLRATVPATVKIDQNINSDSMVLGDLIQIHQVIMNLCTNAVHAMNRNHGKLSVALEDEVFEKETSFIFSTLKPGAYVKLTVSDNGLGISDEILCNIFNPYFTTKGPDAGTGIGLSVVSDIVKGLKGDIAVKSEVGKGTEFSIYFPVGKSNNKPAPQSQEDIQSGVARILFVDDEEQIVSIGKLILEKFGYKVTTLTSSSDALKLYKENPAAFDIVITDLHMPEITGEELAREMVAIRPDLPIIICTGYIKEIKGEWAEIDAIKAIVQKPLMGKELARIINNIIDNTSHENINMEVNNIN